MSSKRKSKKRSRTPPSTTTRQIPKTEPLRDTLPLSAEEQMTERMITKFHNSWAQRDKVYDDFVRGYKQWRKFSVGARKQLESRRRRHINDIDISAIVEEALVKYRPRLEKSAREYSMLGSSTEENSECSGPGIGYGRLVEECEYDPEWWESSTTSPESM
jgi:hypothetical protein